MTETPKNDMTPTPKKDLVFPKKQQAFNGNIIVAPHPDDELIGCYEVLKSGEPAIIIYTGDFDFSRREEAMKLKEHFDNIKVQLFLKQVPNAMLNGDVTLYYPDPSTEQHPEHRFAGIEGEKLARSGFDVVFYSTNMNAPYIHEVCENHEKERLLNLVYPSQKSLWEYEKKYVLFEGKCKWIF